MAYDFSQITDSQLEAVMDDLANDPAASMAMPVEQRRATVAEYNRRRSARQPANVASNLEASATPVAVEPVAGEPAALSRPDAYRERLRSAGYRDNEADTIVRAEGRMPYPFQVPESDSALRAAVGRTRAREARQDAFDQSLALAYGHSAPSVNPDPDTVMVDGVEVPAYLLSDGKPFGGMFREGDLRAAQAAAAEADWQGRFRANQDADRAKYGDWRGRTPEQAANYEARNAAVDRSVATATTARNRPGLQQLESDARDRRRLIANRAMLAGGSSGLRGGPGGNMGMFTALAMLQGVDPATMDAQQQALVEMLPINPDRAKIEAARNAQLTELGLRTAQGRGFQEGTPDRALSQQARNLARADFDAWFDNTLGTSAGAVRGYTWEQHDARVTFLMNQFGISRPEAEAIAQSRGLPSGARSGSERAPGGTPTPAPRYFPDENEPGGMGTPM